MTKGAWRLGERIHEVMRWEMWRQEQGVKEARRKESTRGIIVSRDYTETKRENATCDMKYRAKEARIHESRRQEAMRQETWKQEERNMKRDDRKRGDRKLKD
jgi:hypothetical protein